jgi:hypothetical protein
MTALHPMPKFKLDTMVPFAAYALDAKPNRTYISLMDLAILIYLERACSTQEQIGSDSPHRRVSCVDVLPRSCIFPVVNRSRREILANDTRAACADLTASGRITSIGRERHGGGGKRAVDSRLAGSSIGRRRRRLVMPP